MILPTVLSARPRRFDEVGGGEVADLVPGVDRGGPESDEGVGLAGAGGADDRQVLLSAYPFQPREVVEYLGLDRGLSDVEGLQRLGHGERGGLESVHDVGGIPCRQFGFDQGAQHFLGRPTLGLGGDQDFGCGAAHGGQLQSPQPGIQIGGQRWDRRWCNGFG